MEFQKVFEKYKYAVLSICIALVSVYIFVMRRGETSEAMPNIKQTFYSTDDGKSWFVDDESRLSPFDHDGKPAVRVYVWRSHGKEFVSYMERRTPDANQKVLALRARGPVTTEALAAVDLDGLQVKKPGGSTWHGERDPEFRSIVLPGGPDGSVDDLDPVYP